MKIRGYYYWVALAVFFLAFFFFLSSRHPADFLLQIGLIGFVVGGFGFIVCIGNGFDLVAKAIVGSTNDTGKRPSLDRAIVIAVTAHVGQVDKAGAPYILHSLRVMLAMDDEESRIVGVLHDVIEDSGWTLDALQAEGFSPAVLAGVDAVTRRAGESYETFIDRAACNEIGRKVKRADLRDNSDLSRIANPTDQDRARQAKYLRALVRLA